MIPGARTRVWGGLIVLRLFSVSPSAAAFLEVEESSDSAATIEFWLDPEQIRRERTSEGMLLHFEGAISYGAPGEALLPRLALPLEVPRGTVPKLTVEKREVVRIPGARIALARDYSGLSPLPRGHRTLAPERLGPVTLRRDRRMATLTVDPVRVEEGGLVILTGARYHIEFVPQGIETAEGHRGASSRRDQSRDAVAAFPRYLILCADRFLGNPMLEALVDWRTQRGFRVEVEPLSVAGSTPFSIKGRITAGYESGVTHVLLVGDDPELPTFPGGLVASEHWYSTVSGTDNYADIALGRFAASTADDLEFQIRKTLDYERGQGMGARQSAIASQALLVAHRAEHPGRYTRNCERVAHASYRHPLTFKTAYGGAGATNDDVIAAVVEGLGLVSYRGYGAPEHWMYWDAKGQDFEKADVLAASDGAPWMLVFQVACDNVWIDDDTGPSIGESWMSVGPAAGCLGALRRSYTTANDAFHEELFRLLLNEGIDRAGELVLRAKNFLVDYADEYGDYNARVYLWLGDPDLVLHTRALRRIEASVSGVLECGTEAPRLTVASDGHPVEGAMVTVVRGRKLLSRAVTGGDGHARLSGLENQIEGPALLTITGPALEPLERTIRIVRDGEDHNVGNALRLREKSD